MERIREEIDVLAFVGDIPLLPLPTVLFPGTFMPLQITDRAQAALLRRCADDGTRLGTVLMAGEAHAGRPTVPCTVGCLASIALTVAESEQEAMLSVVLYGEQRMRVVDYTQQSSLLTGRVEPLEDFAGMHAARRTKQAAALFEQYLALVRERYHTEVVDLPLPNDPTLASYLLAAVLTLPQETKQRWLELASAALRLEEELAVLREECEKLSVFLALSKKNHGRYLLPEAEYYLSLVSHN
jgi:Lon protease-like protein